MFGHDHVGHGASQGKRAYIEDVDHYVDDVLEHCSLQKVAKRRKKKYFFFFEGKTPKFSIKLLVFFLNRYSSQIVLDFRILTSVMNVVVCLIYTKSNRRLFRVQWS